MFRNTPRCLASPRPGAYSAGMAQSAPRRIIVNCLVDAALAMLALPMALWLGAPGVAPPGAWWPGALLASALLLPAMGWPLGLARQYWRFAGLTDALAVAAASALAAPAFWALVTLTGAWHPGAPRFSVLHAMVLMFVLSAGRVATRLAAQRRAAGAPDTEVLLAGGADAADLFIRATAADPTGRYRITGILTRRSRQAGRRIQGLPILGTVEETDAVLERLRQEGQLPALIVLAGSDVQGSELEALLDAADHHGVAVKRAPQPTLLGNAARPDEAPRLELRPVSIEELLDRPQVPLDREGMARLIQGRRVLVTGAGGTIGGELSRQVAALGPASLTLLDHGEFALYEIDLELRERHPELPRRSVLADVRDAARIRRLMEELKPELVFHAAALKHVPMVEADPLEGMLTNAQGTRVVADAARAAGCMAMVFISTDKAVNPTSVMGASKRLAEMYCQALDLAGQREGGMRCITVRFGNVLGSTGSVVPLFRRQLERGGPLTVTHPDMRRYFMTVREAVGLVLQAAVVGTAAMHDLPALREGGIFVLDMGNPVKIVDMARRMIRLAGLRPDTDVEIRFTGLRPGEKLYEELFHGQEPPRATPYQGLLMATPRTGDAAVVGRAMDELATLASTGQVAAALAQLGRLVPEFTLDEGSRRVSL